MNVAVMDETRETDTKEGFFGCPDQHQSVTARMKTLITINRQSYDTNVMWHGLQLADVLLDRDVDVRLFITSNTIDLARDFDLEQMLEDLIRRGAKVKICGPCNARWGAHMNETCINGASEATMADLAEWLTNSDRIVAM